VSKMPHIVPQRELPELTGPLPPIPKVGGGEWSCLKIGCVTAIVIVGIVLGGCLISLAKL
jgi:hypothetical protein